MNCEIKDVNNELTEATAKAMYDLTIISRLEFVRNLIFDKGGDGNSIPQDATLVAATDILDGVIDVLIKHPRAARLRNPEP